MANEYIYEYLCPRCLDLFDGDATFEDLAIAIEMLARFALGKRPRGVRPVMLHECSADEGYGLGALVGFRVKKAEEKGARL